MSAATLQVTRLFPDGGRKVVKRTGGRPNGLAVDGDGNLWIAEAGLRAVLCIDPEGREISRIDHDGEQSLRLPNDLCFGKDGHLYLTNSGMAAEDFLDGQSFAKDYRKLSWDGRVYEIDPIKSKVLRIIDRGILFTNGVAFGPDDALYANASFTGEVYGSTFSAPRSPNAKPSATCCNRSTAKISRGPDGMCSGDGGRLSCTVYGQRNVTVLGEDGSVEERLRSKARTQPTALCTVRRYVIMTTVKRGRVEQSQRVVEDFLCIVQARVRRVGLGAPRDRARQWIGHAKAAGSSSDRDVGSPAIMCGRMYSSIISIA